MAKKKNTATSGSESDVAKNQNTEVPAVSTEASVEEVNTLSTEVPAFSTEASVEEFESKTESTFNSVDGTEFEFTVKKFIFKGKEYTSEEALKDVDVLEALIEAKSFVIKKV